MDGTKLYFCFEATNIQQEHVYLLYSAKMSDLICKASDSTPKFTMEVVISGGFPSMGCGVFGSKIVLAGGLVVQGRTVVPNYGLITYDTASKHVSREDIPPMCGRKLRPLVFPLNNKLFVLDTSCYVDDMSFEIWSPKKKLWRRLQSHYFDMCIRYDINEAICRRAPYSWFVFGNCLCVSLPTDMHTYFHHARQFSKSFNPRFQGPLPFSGMATTLYQQGFSDVVVISFSKGCVEGRRVNIAMSVYNYSLGHPQIIFETEPSNGELSSYFADCGDGRFCLTTFDNVNIHVYMFKIRRRKDKKDGALNLHLISKIMHKYDLNNFSTGGNTSFSFLGCFAPARDDRKKQSEEAKIYHRYFPVFEYAKSGGDISKTKEKDDDIPLTVNTITAELTRFGL
ncbi:hypothetical protein OROGR_003801 [Orobanche gracilis]